MAYSNLENQRTYVRKHYQNNRGYYLEKAKRRKEQVRDFIRQAKNKPCADCNQIYPYYVMQFDHVRGDKRLNIGNVSSRGLSMSKLIKEINKCDVVCANCHAIRTHQREKVTKSPKEKTADKQMSLL
jgi:hypothetical protein